MEYKKYIYSAMVKVPEQISAEQRWFRDFIICSADQRSFKVRAKHKW